MKTEDRGPSKFLVSAQPGQQTFKWLDIRWRSCLVLYSFKSRSHPTKPDVSLERLHGVLAAVILSNISARRVSGRRYSGRDD